MTFVHVEERTPEAVKKALFDRKTVVWFNDMILGKEESVKKVLSENLFVVNPSYPKDKTILGFDLVNKSALPIQLEYIGSYSFHEHASVFTIPPYSNMKLKIKTKSNNTSIELPFRVLNAYVGPKKNLTLSLKTK
jgi:hypothetical protein